MLLSVLLFLNFSFADDRAIVVNMFEGEISDVPLRFASWCTTPKVVVCKGSGVTRAQVADTYKFLGQEVSSITTGKCECSVKPGVIQFGIDCFDDNAPGTTYLDFATKNQCMTGSIVEINRNDGLVLAHEGAHSIGWMHSSEIGHLMFPAYNHAGWVTTGMK